MDLHKIRNFCIIAHIDHGKSTLADRLLEITGTIEKRDMKHGQMLDTMELEQERGITIKLQPVRMNWKGYEYNIIDTPGHVDFQYEVSRSLASVEWCLLVVDASQGIEAQTLSNVYLAIENDLEIIPVLNKIDLPAADPERVSEEIMNLLWCDREDIIPVSAKTGQNVESILDAVMERIPEPLVYEGLQVAEKQELKALVWFFAPSYTSSRVIDNGSVGYVVTGLKSIRDAKVWDTLNDSALQTESESSTALWQGFRCWFLGLLHLDIVKERLFREFNMDVIMTSPQVTYHVRMYGDKMSEYSRLLPELIEHEWKTKTILKVSNPEDLPPRETYEAISEPIAKIEIITPKDYVGALMTLCQERRWVFKNQQFIDTTRTMLTYELPMSELIWDFYDEMKSLSSWYGSLNYEFIKYNEDDLAKLDILIAWERVAALSLMCHREQARFIWGKIVNNPSSYLSISRCPWNTLCFPQRCNCWTLWMRCISKE